MPSLLIEPAEPADYSAIADLTLAAYDALPGPPVGDDYRRHLADVASRAAGAVVLVARGPGRTGEPAVLGSVTYVPDDRSPLAENLGPGEAGIRMLAVAPRAQGQSVGTALVEACVARARSEGKRSIALYSTRWMRTAHHLYTRAGFCREEARDWEVEPGFILLSFVKETGTEG